MNAHEPVIKAPSIKGWCPSLLRPMRSGDGLIARIKPSAARLSAMQAHLLAQAAARYGNGQLELTRRGNLQARGFTTANHACFAEEVLAMGLASADPAVEALRNVLAAPLSATEDPSCQFDAHTIACNVEQAIAADSKLLALPSKIGVAVDGGGVLGLTRYAKQRGIVTTADVSIMPGPGGKIALRLAPEATGDVLEVLLPVTMAAEATVALLRSLLDFISPTQRRMADVVAAIGAAPIFTAAGLAWRVADLDTIQADPLGPGSLPITDKQAAIVLAPAFGRLDASQLAALADLANDAGDTTLRLTPWRYFVLPGVAMSSSAAVLKHAEALGFIICRSDPRLQIAVCTGSPGCSHAQADVLRDATIFAAALPADIFLHVSGCGKGCAHSDAADLTLTAQEDGYHLIRNGRASDLPTVKQFTGLSTQAALAALKL